MPSNQINITTADNPNNVVTVLSDDRVIDIKNGRDVSTINVSQTESATVLVGTLSAQGPKGDTGPQGPPGNPGDADLSSLATTGSNVFRGTQTITGSVNITGSLTVNTVNVGQNTLNFIDENGIIVNSLSIPSGSTNITLSTGSIQTSPESFFSGSFTGSFSGNLSGTATTASYISPAFISASAAAAGFGSGGGDTTGLVTTGSFNSFTSSINSFTQSILDWTGSVVTNSKTASFVTTGSFNNFTNSINQFTQSILNWTGSVVTNSQTGSMLAPYLLSSQTGSFVLNSQTGSFATTESFNHFTSSINSFTQSILDWTGSVVTNAVFNSFTQSYNTGSFSGSLKGTADTASYYNETDPIYNAEKGRYLTTGSTGQNQTIVGSLTINQNLTVLGSQSVQYVTSSQLDISTNIITVNVANPAVRFGGIAVIDSGSSPQGSGSFLYDSVQDEFIFVHKGNGTNVTSSHFLVGPETYDDLGNEIYIPANTILKAVGNEHVTSSNITDTGNLVSINSNTDITGRLNVTAGITGSFNGNLIGTASWADSASNAINSQTASYVNANNVFGTVTNASNATNAETASYITGSVFDGNNLALSSSYALTASYALNSTGGSGVGFPFSGSAVITGSLLVSGSGLIVSGGITGSLLGTASFAETASYTPYNQTIGARITTEDFYIIAGSKGYRHVAIPSRITKIRTIANVSGSIDVNIRRDGTNLGNINLTNQSASLDTTLTGWTTILNTNDLIEFYVSQSSVYITDITIFIDTQAT